MSNFNEQLRRAEAWRTSLPPDGRPDPDDVAIVVRLGVRDPQVLARLLLNDAAPLGRRFLELLDAIDGTAPDEAFGTKPVDRVGEQRDPAQSEAVPVMRDSAAEEPTTEHDPETEPSLPNDEDPASDEIDPRRSDLAAYVAEQRAADPKLPWTDEWVDRALADPTGTLEGLPSRVARRHRSRLSAILLDASAGPGGRGSRGDREHRDTDFSLVPDVLAQHRERHLVIISGDDPGQPILTWEAAPTGQYAYFKVFAGVAGKVPLLFDANEIARTEQNRVVDDEPVYGAGRRHYAVWAYLGADVSAARSAAPVLWARGTALQPVEILQMKVSGDRVYGTWQVPPGIERVEVHRLPTPNDVPLTQLPHGYLLGTGVPGEHLTGFDDPDLRAGEYDYRIYAFASVNGQHLRSLPIRRAATVIVPVPQVEDLQVKVVEEPAKTTFDIFWTPPLGQDCKVQIYLRADAAPPGIEGRELDAEGLERNGFTEASLQSFPQTGREDGRVGISFDWPQGLDRVHVTAVTRLGAAYRVGTSKVRNRAGDIAQAKIVERVDEQFLTFGWPSGADFVEVRRGALDAAATDPSTWTQITQVVRERHERYGGLHLRPLPSEGCLLALVGLAYHDGQPTAGETTVLTYPGLTRVDYRLEEHHTTIGNRWRKSEVSAGWRVVVTANQTVDLPLVLVRNPDRLPLHVADGDEVFRVTAPLSNGQPATVWSGLQQGGDLVGFVRLFANLPGAEQLQYAVLDPAPQVLDWGNG